MANSSNQPSHPLRSEPTSKPAGLHLNNWLRLSHDRGPPNTTDANSSPPVTHYRTTTVDGLDIFYREAGPANGPAIVLLHGFPTSSHMFRNLIPLLADRYHVIAPDYPGFGLSAAPDHAA